MNVASIILFVVLVIVFSAIIVYEIVSLIRAIIKRVKEKKNSTLVSTDDSESVRKEE